MSIFSPLVQLVEYYQKILVTYLDPSGHAMGGPWTDFQDVRSGTVQSSEHPCAMLKIFLNIGFPEDKLKILI